MLTQEILKQLLDYDPLSGIFTWKTRNPDKGGFNKQFAGKVAGTKKSGYIRIQINGKPYDAHRLAFLYMEGYIPELIDHKDRVGTNNAWDSLRKSTDSQNAANQPIRSTNISGYKNVSWDKARNKWLVNVMKDGKTIYGGRFSELEDAVKAANNLRLSLFGNFAIYEEFTK